MPSPANRVAAMEGGYWLARIGLVASLAVAAPASAKPSGGQAWMIRMLACESEDARMKIYLPLSIVFTGHSLRASRTVNGYYTLDLTGANKGKSLEPVRVTLSADRTTVTVDQYTRGLPPTRIPLSGGTVDFDQRFGTAAKCGPFQAQDPNFAN